MKNVILKINCPYREDIEEFELPFKYKRQGNHDFYEAQCIHCEKKCGFKTWEIEPHTKKKIEILKNYLNAWFPKLLRTKNVLYIDPFAGPGVYTNYKYGSPTTAVESYINYINWKDREGEASFIFIEKETEITNMLRSEIKKIKRRFPDITVNIFEGDNQTEVQELIERDVNNFPPTFIFIDPFGLTILPFHLVNKILKRQSSEVMIHIMYQFINRFIDEKSIDDSLNEMFGSDTIVEELRIAIELTESSEDRYNLIRDKYIQCLRRYTGVKYILPFLLKDDGNKRFSILFFATNHLEGLKVMKKSMWGIDPTGNFEFSDFEEYKKLRQIETDKQISLFDVKEYSSIVNEKDLLFKKLANYVYEEFKGLKNKPFNEIEKFVLEETIYLDSHIIEHALKPLIQDGKLEKTQARKQNYKDAIYNFK